MHLKSFENPLCPKVKQMKGGIMHKKLARYYRTIERSYPHEPKTARQAKVLLCNCVNKPEGFKISQRQAESSPSHCCLMFLGFAVCENGFFKACPDVIKSTR